MFKDADVVVFIGGFPRKKGMERKDLLEMNKKIFVEQAKALSSAKPNVRCVVVANPANTNAYILSHFNPSIPKQNITCLTRLDHNRAVSQLMLKTHSRPEDIKNVMIFGNHSLTQYPSINTPKIKQKPVS
jgi:malate dehydrogenase